MRHISINNSSGASAPATESADLQADSADPRVTAVLQSAGFGYHQTPWGDILLEIEVDEERYQLSVLSARTIRLGSRENRSVYSSGYADGHQFPERVLQDLLRRNAVVPVGAWAITETEGIHQAIFSLDVPADAPAVELIAAAAYVATAAHELHLALEPNDPLWS